MDGDSLFGVSALIMENGISSVSWNPFSSDDQKHWTSPANGDRGAVETVRENHSDQDCDVKTESSVLPNTTSLTKSDSVHQTAQFSDDPFPAPDWVSFPPPESFKDHTANGFRSTSDTRSEEIDIFQPYKEKADTDFNQNAESWPSSNQNAESWPSSNQNAESWPSSNQSTESWPSSNQNTECWPSSNQNAESWPSSNQNAESWPSSNQNAESWPSSHQKDPLLEYILSRGKTFPAPASEPPSVNQEASSKADGFLKAPSASSSPFVSDTNDIFKRSEVSDIQALDPLFAPQTEVRSSQKSEEDLLLSRQDEAHDVSTDRVLQETPALASSSTNLSNGDLMFRRRPPRAAPRSKAPKPPALPQITSTEMERDPLVYEDVLLIGQENCVEDWPEHSPELSPDWKPAGRLRLRRDSVRIPAASAGGGEEGLKKSGRQSLGRRLRHSLLIRRSSKDKSGDEVKSPETNSVSLNPGSKLINGTEEFFAQDEEQNEAAEYKSKKPSKPKIITLRRSSKVKSAEAPDYKDDLTSSWKHDDLERLREKKAEDVDCKPKQPHKFNPPVPHRPSKSFSKDRSLEEDLDPGASVRDSHQVKLVLSPEMDTHLDDEEPNTEETDGQQKWRKKVRVQFVPRRGFVIARSRHDRTNQTQEETPHLKDGADAELKGACGFTPHPPTKDGERFDDLKGALGHELKTDTLLKSEAGRSAQRSYSNGVTSPAWDSKADLETDVCGSSALFTPSDASEKHQRVKFPRLHRRQSKSFEEAEMNEGRDSQMKKPPLLSHRDSKKGADLFKAGDVEPAEEYTLDNKPQKHTETEALHRGSKCPPGDLHLSDAAKAEWLSAQMDMRRLKDEEEEQKLEEEEDEGDTDSLMEWWNTVESWDEIRPDEAISTKEEETISFKAVADRVHRGLRVYLKLFMERAELLYQHVLILYGIADDLSNFHHNAKIANITGGTTTAVGGAAAIVGLALIPVTFGASIIISAVGLGVATAGGITAASASLSDTINNMHDRKKIEIIIMDYEAQLVEMQHCLRFVIEGLCRLRSHPLLRRNNYYTGDWEVRRALQTISLASDPVERAEELIQRTLAKLASLQKGIDKYFTKDLKEVKKGCKKEVTAEVRSLAKQLHEGLAELNSIREQLLDAGGYI
ncbi:uncharacterized protein LOC113076105 isoform X3 [Carassius auratus]|uniref:Uncharacterized protein LOC113076105 isoform X3 n=1 Tax=Carassius auratus TaxID=7957 RepID=A0A6P6N617_CARAU|nr:uncharacterized protein LOC113076105 isoform X3 [Carassius auratus]